MCLDSRVVLHLLVRRLGLSEVMILRPMLLLVKVLTRSMLHLVWVNRANRMLLEWTRGRRHHMLKLRILLMHRELGWHFGGTWSRIDGD